MLFTFCLLHLKYHLISLTTYHNRPTYDEVAEECTHKMAKDHNQCLAKSEDKTFLETYNCEYIKSPKPERFARAMVSTMLMLHG